MIFCTKERIFKNCSQILFFTSQTTRLIEENSFEFN